MTVDPKWIVFTLDGANEFVQLEEALEFVEWWSGHCIVVSLMQPPSELMSMVSAVLLAYVQSAAPYADGDLPF